MDKYKELTGKGKDEYLKVLEQIGWFKFPHNKKEEIAAKLDNQEKPDDFVLALSALSFDASLLEDEMQYESLMQDVINVSEISIKNKRIDYLATSDTFKFNIKTEDNTYQYHLRMDDYGDWLEDDNLLNAYVNKRVLRGEKVEGRFLPIPSTCDKKMQFVFITKKIYKKAVDTGIIPGDLTYFND